MSRSSEARRDLPRVDRSLTVRLRCAAEAEQVCILENASRLGAGLRVHPEMPLPKRFALVIEHLTVPVVLRWRRGDRAGVRFAEGPSDDLDLWLSLGGRPGIRV